MTHKLHMRFERCQGWRVSFRDLSDGRAQFREFNFADAGKIKALMDRTATKMVLEDRNAFELGLRNGLGAANLTVTDEQYRKLLR